MGRIMLHIYSIWQMPLYRVIYICLIYTTEQSRALLKDPAVAACQYWDLNSQTSDQ